MTDKKLTQGELEDKVYDYVDTLDSVEAKELLIDLLYDHAVKLDETARNQMIKYWEGSNSQNNTTFKLPS